MSNRRKRKPHRTLHAAILRHSSSRRTATRTTGPVGAPSRHEQDELHGGTRVLRVEHSARRLGTTVRLVPRQLSAHICPRGARAERGSRRGQLRKTGGKRRQSPRSISQIRRSA